MKKKSLFCVLILAALLFGQIGVVFAQEDDYTVHMSRNFGYGGGVNIRGVFTISLRGGEAAVRNVRFIIDGETLAEVGSAPFTFKFETDDYGFGVHDLWAEVELRDGSSLTTSSVQYNFVSPEEEREQVGSVMGVILGGVVVILLIVGLVQGTLLKGSRKERHQPGEPRNYGMMGGTICPKCGRPFPRHFFGLNLVVGRLDRCDNCGKWSMTTRATMAELHTAEDAEKAELVADQAVTVVKEDQKSALDDTQYIDQI